MVTLIYISSSNYLLEQHKLYVRRYVASGRDISGGNYVNVKSKTIDEVVFPYGAGDGAGDGNRTRMTMAGFSRDLGAPKAFYKCR